PTPKKPQAVVGLLFCGRVKTVAAMDTSATDTRPTFSRLTEGRTRHSWRAAVPVVLVIVAFVALIAYLASRLSSYSQRADVAERDANQYRDQVTAITKQVGDPVDIGVVEADQNGSGFAMKSDLPAIDQGKSVMLTTDAQGAKRPGDVIARADLPKLKPTAIAEASQAQGEQTPAAQNPKAKSGSETQQMHQPGK